MLKKLCKKYGVEAVFYGLVAWVFVAGFLLGLAVGYTVAVSQATNAMEISPVEEVTPTPTSDVPPVPEYSEMEFIATAYCCENYPHICNDGDATRTATGTVPTAGRTIAVDPNFIPYGTEIIINGNTYVAEDCGGAIKGSERIDILFDTHEEAKRFGRQKITALVRA